MTERLSAREMTDELSKLLYGKLDWLSRFSTGRNKRPEHELDRVRRERDVLSQAAHDYRRATERERGAA